MTIAEAVKKIIELKSLDIFKNLKHFLAFLDDLAPEYQKERKIIKNNFDENILGLFVDESKRPNQRLRWVQIKLDDVGLAKDWADFIIESFGLALGWENELQDLKVNAPILNNAPKANSQQESVNPNVQDVTLNDDVLKQWGFTDKNSIPTVLNIPSTYKTLFGITYRIVKIGDEVFKDCDKLQIVTIPDTVKEIGDSAFENCKVLEKINIPDSVNKIGKKSFVNCKSLNSINLPNDITEIGDGAFCGCESLITAVIPNKVTKIAEGLFGKCKSLVNITIPNGVTEIGDLAFAGCESLNSVIIPKTVTKIGNKAFANCKSIDSIIIPNTVTDINAEVFAGCIKLQQFTLPTRFTIFPFKINYEEEFNKLRSLLKIQNDLNKIYREELSKQREILEKIFNLEKISNENYSKQELELKKIQHLKEILKEKLDQINQYCQQFNLEEIHITDDELKDYKLGELINNFDNEELFKQKLELEKIKYLKEIFTDELVKLKKNVDSTLKHLNEMAVEELVRLEERYLKLGVKEIYRDESSRYSNYSYSFYENISIQELIKLGQVYVCNIPLNKINRNKLMKHKACLESKNLSNIDKAELIKDLKDLIAISQSLSIEELAEREFSSLSGKMSEIYWKRQANNF